MAGRNHMPRYPDNFRSVHDGPRAFLDRGPGPVPHPVALEEELELQHRDIQRLLAENRNVVDDNVMLQRELTAVKDEIHRMGQAIPKLRADREIQTRELIDRGLKLEAELRSAEPLRGELVQLRGEAQKLSTLRQELSSQVQTLTKDINRMQAENLQIAAMKTDIDKMGKELVDARRMYEYEKKGNEELVEQNRSMEKNLLSMAREIEKLRAEQASIERRPRGGIDARRMYEYEKKGNEELVEQNRSMEKNLLSMAREIEKLRAEQASIERRPRGGLGAGGYGLMNGSPETRYPGPYGDVYGAGPWGSYDKRGPPRH